MPAEVKGERRLPPLPERYRPLGHIASGGMASVIRAEDGLLGREVAIKVLASNLAEDQQMVERFQREARTAAGLSAHPRIITIYDVGEHEGRPFIVMEHLAGGTVGDRIAAGPVPRADALRWIRQAAEALDTAHAAGFVHRDVKPGNLLLDDAGNLVVADFGIAKALEGDSTITSTGIVLGTAAYISPEQVRGEPATDASDRYSLAVVAFELLCGHRPLGGDSHAAQARAAAELPPPPPSRHDPSLAPLDPVLLRGLDKEPSRRWPTALEFAGATERALQNAPTTATVPMAAQAPPPEEPPPAPPAHSSPAPLPPPHRRRRSGLPLALIIGGLAALVAVGVALTSGGGDDPPERSSGEATQTQTQTQTQAQTQAPEAPAQGGSERQPVSDGTSNGAELNRQGFELMNRGRYEEAVPVLQRAVDSFPAGTDDINYAFALYNLGRSLRLAGRPAEAIPVLERRLEIPNQRGTVQRELDAARAAAGGGAASGDAADDDGGG